MRHAGTFQIPTYAIPMLEYGDTTGLTDLDIELLCGGLDGHRRALFRKPSRIWHSSRGS